MTYRIALRSDLDGDEHDSDNAQTALERLSLLRDAFPDKAYVILRNNRIITEAELENDAAPQNAFTRTSILPSNYQKGGCGAIDDLGLAPDHKRNEPTAVRRPPNPEDDY